MPYTIKANAPVFKDARQTQEIGETVGESQQFVALESAHNSLKADKLDILNNDDAFETLNGVWVKFSDSVKVEGEPGPGPTGPVEPPETLPEIEEELALAFLDLMKAFKTFWKA